MLLYAKVDPQVEPGKREKTGVRAFPLAISLLISFVKFKVVAERATKIRQMKPFRSLVNSKSRMVRLESNEERCSEVV